MGGRAGRDVGSFLVRTPQNSLAADPQDTLPCYVHFPILVGDDDGCNDDDEQFQILVDDDDFFPIRDDAYFVSTGKISLPPFSRWWAEPLSTLLANDSPLLIFVLTLFDLS